MKTSKFTEEQKRAHALRQVGERDDAGGRLLTCGRQRSHLLHLEEEYAHLGVSRLRRPLALK